MDSNKIKKSIPFGIVFIIIFFIIVLVFNGFTYTTNENQFAVVKQFGKIIGVNDSAGLSPKIPFIQDVNYISKATRLYDMNPSEVITSDKKTMIIDCFVLWNVTDAKVLLRL